MLHTTYRVAAAVAVAVVLAGCASTSPASDPAPARQAQASSAPTVGEHPQVAPDAPAASSVAWDQSSKAAALDVATKAMTLYARPSVGEEKWLADLKPLFTPAAAEDYAYVDPSLIPISTFGVGDLSIDESNGYAVLARFGSPAGTYGVQLHRTGKDAPFKVVRFVVPEGAK